jgi:hypothetical protein
MESNVHAKLALRRSSSISHLSTNKTVLPWLQCGSVHGASASLDKRLFIENWGTQAGSLLSNLRRSVPACADRTGSDYVA